MEVAPVTGENAREGVEEVVVGDEVEEEDDLEMTMVSSKFFWSLLMSKVLYFMTASFARR